jgi:hypothetical protein
VSNDVKIRLSLTENVSKQLRGVSKQFDKLGGRGSGASLFGNVGAKAVAKGFDLIGEAAGGAIGFLEDSVRKAADAQVAQTLLAGALQNNVKYWDGSTQAIEDNITSNLRLGFTQSDQTTTMAKLVTATGSVKDAMDQMRVAMDLARFKNIPLQDAADLLTKALHGNRRALKSLGIELPKTATKGEIMRAIQEKLTGTAERYANTLDGKVAGANARLDAAEERIGKITTPILTTAVSNFADMLDYMAGDPTKQATGALKVIQDNVNALQRGVEKLTTWWGHLFDSMAAAETAASQPVFSSGHGFGRPSSSSHPAGYVQPHAAGGWVGLNGPEIGLLGEKGPEYITPAGQMRGGGFTIQGVSEQQILDMVDRGLYFRLKRSGTAR